MLRKVKASKNKVPGGRFAIIASEYNAEYVNSMLAAAERILQKSGADEVQVIRVPGAYEIPVVVAKLAGAAQKRVSAIVCLGVIIRGETAHAQLIAEAVTRALTEIQLKNGVPVIHEVLLLENERQAAARCLSEEHNRGAEAAQTAVEMARIMRDLS